VNGDLWKELHFKPGSVLPGVSEKLPEDPVHLPPQGHGTMAGVQCERSKLATNWLSDLPDFKFLNYFST
jgi:hypothetical protein